ncbi:DNA repair protein RecO [Corynebacterium sp. ES2794-CONJ1]|uniref:DNA repair protein RecO n=1 Tax=unclassified Corynebacterium TaxID=2624378 RepID=UPI0021682D4F|nr:MULTISPECIES: DNA repair protein RecO [unclassified Corynebacterium]MCS4490586.1 DNA repair protein RecO [Corynebacterium sp. ES2775-CONJ]MCS4492365.1 DNA repair protein RecO [Corynebacterium sp. ES2715-CONJ3]MCS4532443.1 DNA repair protein RecO [Corynebacterium sp. ES2730-CONJ]MCU9519838.1 DNA repair protein RecO [Corynebacterium sp. ES2794-CONJ1]
MARQSYKVRAVVVRTYDFGEADRIVVLLSKEHGIIRAVAKGVRRAKSRFGSRLQPFVEIDVQLYPGRNLETLTQADTVRFFATGIVEDSQRFIAATAILEVAERLAEDDLYDLVLDHIELMRQTAYPTVVLDAFLLQAMHIAGWAPSLFLCAQCQKPGPHHAFHPAPGGAVCVNCRPPGSKELDPEALHIAWLLEHQFLDNAIEIIAQSSHFQAEVHQFVRLHFQWYAERKIAALEVLDQV